MSTILIFYITDDQSEVGETFVLKNNEQRTQQACLRTPFTSLFMFICDLIFQEKVPAIRRTKIAGWYF